MVNHSYIQDILLLLVVRQNILHFIIYCKYGLFLKYKYVRIQYLIHTYV